MAEKVTGKRDEGSFWLNFSQVLQAVVEKMSI